jgi:hypothetical protein
MHPTYKSESYTSEEEGGVYGMYVREQKGKYRFGRAWIKHSTWRTSKHRREDNIKTRY